MSSETTNTKLRYLKHLYMTWQVNPYGGVAWTTTSLSVIDQTLAIQQSGVPALAKGRLLLKMFPSNLDNREQVFPRPRSCHACGMYAPILQLLYFLLWPHSCPLAESCSSSNVCSRLLISNAEYALSDRLDQGNLGREQMSAR